ncbi:probable inactive histone-lysine N-methyltransferase SUVR2 isoform X2 [Brachypodium distachyon]|uniref:probable inactive histone-lysine N-methyltransferase SUVR2 isoform X2 n=1 Tax=Brachypodium distachyon TaxID=15368 RepID=UPI00071C875B|nr:probable inactive histone-lysine N-methyltransferase SUVR2 isoform X2 [Brachypodium distachyon]|eukprot:XP_003573231.3 probable inactive histone-lysine N-methyltransferase SUVR2 isoform X2 [Brachypodium distachyon]
MGLLMEACLSLLFYKPFIFPSVPIPSASATTTDAGRDASSSSPPHRKRWDCLLLLLNNNMGSNNERFKKAFEAMKPLGISKKQMKPILRHLYNLFDKNWEPIEEENYRILADAILDAQNERPMPAAPNDETNGEPTPHSSTQLRPDDQRPSASASCYYTDVNDNETPLIKRSRRSRMSSADFVHEQPTQPIAIEGMSSQPASLQPNEPIRALAVVRQADDHGDPSSIVACKRDKGLLLESPEDVLFLNGPEPEIDLPAAPVAKHLNTSSSGGKNMLIKHSKTREVLGSGADEVGYPVQNTPQTPSVELDLASSTMGEVKMSLKCKFDPSKVRISLDKVLKMVEDKCLRSYKILPPDFSIGKLMNEVCQYVAESGAVHSEAQSKGGSLQKEAVESDAPSVKPIACKHAVDGNSNAAVGFTVSESSEPTFQNCIVSCQPELPLSKQRPLHDVADISKGEERVSIPIVNEFGSESCPPLFYYIRKNLVFQSAYVHTSLARIGNEDCCTDCSGDCLLAPLPCSCSRLTGGEFAYTPEGLVKGEFLDECIAVNHFPEKHNKFYCKACPLERSKNNALPDPCKGHLARKFIKECWSKCGCGMQCGNRVVQCGITCNLQVFFTKEGKGWGLRTLDELPKGAFICEYVGEILTNTELHKRTVQNEKRSKHVHQVLLDANWGSEGVSRDEEALCLDPTFYGNVGRFVNHRCYDSNLVVIPVEVETPDRHYYHVAFFAARKIKAFEELTWDYGIDFDGTDIAFECMCGSKYCRNPKNSRKRARAATSGS